MAAGSNQLRILLVGDSETGKDCYVTRLVNNTFPAKLTSNKEYEIVSTQIKIDEETQVPIQIINVAGSQRGKTKIQEYFKNIDGYIVVFDVTRGETYDNIISWKDNIVKVNKTENLPSLLLANKCDLEKDPGLNRMMDVMENYREVLGFNAYFQTSAKDDLNIELSMQTFVHEILTWRKRPTSIVSPSPVAPRLSEDRKREYRLKIIVIGDPGTGKTAVIQRYVTNTFSGVYRNTIGSDLAMKKINYDNNTIVNLHLWDIAGDERFGAMTHVFYKDTDGCLIVFDVNRPSTLEVGALKWKADFDKKVNHDDTKPIPCILLGNKCDLEKEGIVQSEAEMTEFCRKHGFAKWCETSARTNKNLTQSFQTLVNEMMNNVAPERVVKPRRPSEQIIVPRQTEVKKKTLPDCCPS